MTKKVIVSSVHTCTPYALDETGLYYDAIVSVDSHLDGLFLHFTEALTNPLKDNWNLRYALGRVAVHTFMSRMLGLEAVYLLISPPMFETFVVSGLTLAQIHNPDLRLEADYESEFKQLMKENFNLRIKNIMPDKALKEIGKIFKKHDVTVLDIDVDYFEEMQKECYTPMKNVPSGIFGNASRMLKTIKKVEPETITFSEATISALNDPNSNTNKFLDRLADFGYEREDFWLYKNDEIAIKSMNKADNFSDYSQRNRKILSPNDDGFMKEQGELAKKYFADDSLGLGDPFESETYKKQRAMR